MSDLRVRDFPADVQHKAKVAAMKRGESLKALVIRAVERELALLEADER